MADEHTEPMTWVRRSSARVTSYPWGQWLNGSVWTIRRGEDFSPDVKIMRAVLYRGCSQFGDLKRMRTQIDGDSITFQALPYYQT